MTARPSAVHVASTKTQRAQRRDSWRAIVRRSFVDHEESVERWAEHAGVGRTVAHQVVSHDGGAELQVADVETLPEAVRLDVVEALARTCGRTLSVLPTADDIEAFGSDVERLGRMAEQLSAAIAEYARAIADGTITAVEAERVEAKCTQAMQALATIRERVRLVRRERVVGVRVLREAGR